MSKGYSILINAHSRLRYVLPALAGLLKERTGAEIHFYCNGPSQYRFYVMFLNDGTFNSLQTLDDLNYADEFDDEAAVVAEARDWENRIGITYNELVITNRHFGRGFWLGGTRHQRSPISVSTDYIAMNAVLNKRMDYWANEIRTKRAFLCIDGPRELIAVCSAMDVPYRRMFRSRFGNNFIWVHDDKYLNPLVEKIYEALPQKVELPVIQDTTKTYAFGRDRVVDVYKDSIVKPLMVIGRKILDHIYYRVSGSEKRHTAYMWDEVMSLARMWHCIRTMYRGRLPGLDILEGKPFVFFPLQQEPEFSIHGQSPEYFFQMEAIASIARDLPAGTYLAVKETYFAAGRRPKDFYRQIESFKNVVHLDMGESGLETIKRAAVTATISGSPGHEAAVLGKPVLSFGRHNPYNFLDHVHVVEDPGVMRPLLHSLLENPEPTEKSIEDGKRYQKAVIDTCFDMGKFNLLQANEPEADAVERAYNALVLACDGVASNLFRVGDTELSALGATRSPLTLTE